MVLPILLSFGMRMISNHGVGSWSPISRTYFSMLIDMLKSLNESINLIDIPSNRCIINTDMSDELSLINNEGSSQTISIID